MKSNRIWIIAITSCLFLVTSPIPAASDPCCIIVVPPPPPPPPSSETSFAPLYGLIYSQLPLFAAIEKKTFGASLTVEIRRKSSLREALSIVNSTQGALGLATINALAWHKVKTKADLEIVAVTINRPYYALYTLPDGPAMLEGLKGKVINISSYDIAGRLYTVKALRSAGLSEKDVKFISISAAGPAHLEVANALESQRAEAGTAYIGYEAVAPKLKLKQIKAVKPITFPSWVIYTNSVTLDKEINKVNQFIKGFTEGINIIKKDQQLTRKILNQKFNISNQTIQNFIVKNIPLFLSDSVRPDPKDIKLTAEIIGSISKYYKAPILLDQERLQKLYQ